MPLGYELLLPDLFPINQCFYRRSPVALLTLMGIVVNQPFVQIGLNHLNTRIQRLSQCRLIKLLQNRFMEAFTDSIRLGLAPTKTQTLSS